MKLRDFITLFSVLLLSLTAVQTVEAQEDLNVSMAEEMVGNEDFSAAVEMYKKLITFDPLDPELYFSLGFCYLNTPEMKELAPDCFRNALELYKPKQRKGTQGIEAEFYLGRSLRVNNQLPEALDLFNKLTKRVSNKKFLEIVHKEIDMCNLAMTLQDEADTVSLPVNNLGRVVNSPYTDHSPLITADESTLFFTSRRPCKNGAMQFDGQFDENIYVSYRNEDNTWTVPMSVSDSINTKEHEATAAISYDGRELYIYRDVDDGSIWASFFDDSEWSAPKQLNSNINTKYRETGASVSADGSKLYIASDRPDGYGGLDIYVSERLTNGEWGEAKNLGPAVNTAEDEEGPYIMPDNSRLYFSSKGHEGIGGYDIFYCDATEFGTWSRAVNVGFPVNTAQDDVFLFFTPSGERAYFASVREDAVGRSDIYVMGLPQEMETQFTVMTGRVTVCSGYLPESKVTIIDNNTGIVSTAIPNLRTGKFIFIVTRSHSYNITVTSSEKDIFNEDLFVPADAEGMMDYKSIKLDPSVECDLPPEEFPVAVEQKPFVDQEGVVYDMQATVSDIRFPFAKAPYIKKNDELDSLAAYLKKFPEAVVEIGAYADSKGPANYNRFLSLQRAKAVYYYLYKKGVRPNQMVTVGYGEENPVAFNVIDGKLNEQSMDYNRRVEFRMIKQGKKSLLIKPLTDIPEKFQNPAYSKKYQLSGIIVEIEI